MEVPRKQIDFGYDNDDGKVCILIYDFRIYIVLCYKYQNMPKHLCIYIYLQISISTTGLVLYGVCFVGFIIIVVFLLFCGITFNNRTPKASQKKAKGNGGRVERPRMFNICHAWWPYKLSVCTKICFKIFSHAYLLNTKMNINIDLV